jgi:hypothetical protein
MLWIIIFFLLIVISIFSYISFDKIKTFLNSNINLITDDNKTQTWDVITIKDIYYIWDPVFAEWRISKTDWIFDYTHKLEKTNWEIFWIKSNKIDLSNYWWNIQIKWIVVDKKNNITILNIDEIIEDKNEELESFSWDISVEYWTWIWNIPKFWLTLSFGDDYIIQENNDSIIVQAIVENNSGNNYEDVLTIHPMICEKWSSTRDCENIEKIFNRFDTFVSSNWIKYYKIPETNRYFFSNHLLWYNITANSNLDIWFLSQYIDYFNLNKLEELLNKHISPYCTDENNTMTNVDNFNYYFDWNTFDSLKLKILGTDKNLNKLECKLKINLWNPITTEFSELNNSWIKKTSWIKNKESEIINVINKPKTADNDTVILNETDETINRSKYLEFTSKRWYTIYFPSKSIAFQTFTINESLWITWIECNLKINIVNYKEKWKLWTNPDVEIFDCKSSLDTEWINNFLEWTNMVYKPFKEKQFIVRYNNINYKDFANNIFFE